MGPIVITVAFDGEIDTVNAPRSAPGVHNVMLFLLPLAFQSSMTDALLIAKKRVASNTEHHEATGYPGL